MLPNQSVRPLSAAAATSDMSAFTSATSRGHSPTHDAAPRYTAPDRMAQTQSVTRSTRTVNVGEAHAARCVPYDIECVGSEIAAHSLFPEEGSVVLEHEPIPELPYEYAMNALLPRQHQALREWTSTEADMEHEEEDNSKRYYEGVNYELNAALSKGTLTGLERAAVEALDGGLAAMPCFRARLTRVAEHGPTNPSPWGTRIQIGDIVTAGPRFMSASHTHGYSLGNLSDGSLSSLCLGKDSESLVFYTIDASAAVPLVEGKLAFAGESEWLFRPRTAFTVLGMAQARPRQTSAPGNDGNTNELPARRYGVHLRQIEDYEGPAKNLYTGAPVLIR